jgi:hypothetical protein
MSNVKGVKLIKICEVSIIYKGGEVEVENIKRGRIRICNLNVIIRDHNRLCTIVETKARL